MRYGGTTQRDFRIVGYLPDYRVPGFNTALAKGLTDLVFFGVVPNAGGDLGIANVKPEALALLGKIKAEHGVRLHLCLGGWNRSQGFAALAAAPAARKRLAAECVAFCAKQRFDGVDVDWEHPANDAERANHAALLGTLKAAFAPAGLRLTAAVAGWQTLDPAAIAAVDALHLMAYDAEGRHSTYDYAAGEVRKALARGAPAEKLCLGLPFYGRHLTNRDQALGYGEILRLHRPPPGADESAGFCFNGPDTIARKTKFALDQRLGGVMAWEIAQDAPGGESLLRAIVKTAAVTCPP